MTRINVGFPPQRLTRQMLIAEHREIKRIPNLVAAGRANLGNIPATFTLGTGHVKFFYNKLGYLKRRYELVYEECLKRGYNVTNYTSAWDNVPHGLMGEWECTPEAQTLIEERIEEKMLTPARHGNGEMKNE